jgi:hypothetical protein
MAATKKNIKKRVKKKKQINLFCKLKQAYCWLEKQNEELSEIFVSILILQS